MVEKGVSLTIESGTLVEVFEKRYLYIDGTLMVNGSAQKPVRIAGKGNLPGSWGSIKINSSGKLIMKQTYNIKNNFRNLVNVKDEFVRSSLLLHFSDLPPVIVPVVVLVPAHSFVEA